MRIAMLMENTACAPSFAHEHGLSCYVEANNKKLLFDMGQSGLFMQNADVLDIALNEVDVAVVSHGHYDHGGGLKDFLMVNSHAPVYMHRSAFEPHFSRKPDGVKPIGLDRELMKNDRVILTDGVCKIDENMTLFSDIEGEECCPLGNRTLYEQKDGALVPDGFAHEQSLVIREGEKTVLLAGCAHRGVVNICARAKELIGADPDYVIGGMHLFSPSTGKSEPDENIHAVAARLAQTNSHYYTCHCTGQYAFALLQQTLGDRIAFLSAGSVLEL